MTLIYFRRSLFRRMAIIANRSPLNRGSRFRIVVHNFATCKKTQFQPLLAIMHNWTATGRPRSNPGREGAPRTSQCHPPPPPRTTFRSFRDRFWSVPDSISIYVFDIFSDGSCVFFSEDTRYNAQLDRHRAPKKRPRAPKERQGPPNALPRNPKLRDSFGVDVEPPRARFKRCLG